MKLLVLASLLLVAPLLGADLQLADGRVLAEYKVVSQTPTTVTVRHKGGASKVDKTLLPAAVLAAYPIDKDAAEAEARKLAELEAAGKRRRAAVEERRLRELGLPPSEVRRRLVEQGLATPLPAAPPAAAAPAPAAAAPAAPKPAGPPSADVLRAVSRAAERYFKTQHTNGSGSTLVFDLSIDLDTVREVVGWPGRFEVTGVCSYQYYDSVWGGSFKGVTKYFSTVADTAGAAIRVGGIDLHSGPALSK